MGKAATRREQRKLERRETILEAAARVFEARGAGAATMEEIAEAADVSKGTLYLYFPSKDDLFVALTLGPLDAVLARFAALLEDEAADGLTLLRRLVDAHHAVMRAHAPRMRIALASMCGGFEVEPDTLSLRDYSKRVQELRQTYLDVIQRGMEDGSIRRDLDRHEVSLALWASHFGASFIRMNADRFGRQMDDPGAATQFERVDEAVTKLFFDAIAAPSRRQP